jgi:hypothetical protein
MDKTGRDDWVKGGKVIRQRNGKIIGVIKTDPSSGMQTGYDSRGNLKGRYRPKNDMTYDHENAPVSYGNTLVALILDCVCSKGVGNVCHPVAVLETGKRSSGLARLAWLLERLFQRPRSTRLPNRALFQWD